MKLIFLILGFSSVGFADVDYTCLNNCTRKNYEYNFCQQHCSYNNQQNQQEQRNYRNSADEQNAKTYGRGSTMNSLRNYGN